MKKLLKNFKFWFYYIKFKRLEKVLEQEFKDINFKKTKMSTIMYINLKNEYQDALDYTMFRIYGIFGCDSLTKKERRIIEK